MFNQPDIAPVDIGQALNESEFIALDLELTSLAIKQCQIVAIGIQPFTLRGFHLGDRQQWLVRSEVGNSATIHQTTDQMLQSAPYIAQVLPEVLLACANKVVVVHNKFIEQPVLARHAKQLLGWHFAPVYFDTMAFAMNKAGPHRDEFKHDRFTLSACRQDAGLPKLTAHNALIDAQATAELCLAQCATLTKKMTISQALKHFA